MSRTASRALGEVVALAVVVAEQLHHERAGDVEALGDRVVHRRVELEASRVIDLQLPADATGRDDERREHDQRQDREPPLEEEHHAQRDDERDHVLDDGADRVGDRLLRADHVVVQPAGQRTGLRAGEERDRQPLHVVEERDPHVVDQALTDA